MTITAGLIGLGAMGHGMAQSLRRAGYLVHVYDVRSDVAEAFAKEGGVAAGSPSELAAACDVIISVVVNAAQTESALFGPDGCAAAMQPGSVFVMCSTVEPSWSVALEKRLNDMD
ncbi:MAG: NAD(P)-binding domain-containing protein, partial [Polaromonas sp.]